MHVFPRANDRGVTFQLKLPLYRAKVLTNKGSTGGLHSIMNLAARASAPAQAGGGPPTGEGDEGEDSDGSSDQGCFGMRNDFAGPVVDEDRQESQMDWFVPDFNVDLNAPASVSGSVHAKGNMSHRGSHGVGVGSPEHRHSAHDIPSASGSISNSQRHLHSKQPSALNRNASHQQSGAVIGLSRHGTHQQSGAAIGLTRHGTHQQSGTAIGLGLGLRTPPLAGALASTRMALNTTMSSRNSRTSGQTQLGRVVSGMLHPRPKSEVVDAEVVLVGGGAAGSGSGKVGSGKAGGGADTGMLSNMNDLFAQLGAGFSNVGQGLAQAASRSLSLVASPAISEHQGERDRDNASGRRSQVSAKNGGSNRSIGKNGSSRSVGKNGSSRSVGKNASNVSNGSIGSGGVKRVESNKSLGNVSGHGSAHGQGSGPEQGQGSGAGQHSHHHNQGNESQAVATSRASPGHSRGASAKAPGSTHSSLKYVTDSGKNSALHPHPHPHPHTTNPNKGTTSAISMNESVKGSGTAAVPPAAMAAAAGAGGGGGGAAMTHKKAVTEALEFVSTRHS